MRRVGVPVQASFFEMVAQPSFRTSVRRDKPQTPCDWSVKSRPTCADRLREAYNTYTATKPGWFPHLEGPPETNRPMMGSR